jgi:hypothetical protein
LSNVTFAMGFSFSMLRLFSGNSGAGAGGPVPVEPD